MVGPEVTQVGRRRVTTLDRCTRRPPRGSNFLYGFKLVSAYRLRDSGNDEGGTPPRTIRASESRLIPTQGL
jgi:hypothetical protein